MIDSRDLVDVRADVESLQTQAPHVAALVFAEADQKKNVAAALRGSTAFAVLQVPVNRRKFSKVFSGAVAESKVKQAVLRPSVAEKNTVVVVENAVPAVPEPIRPQFRDTAERTVDFRIIGGIAVVVLAAVALWYLTRNRGTAHEKSAPVAARSTQVSAVPAQEAPPAIEISLANGTVDELLEKARNTMRERRYTEPIGDNALLYYRSAAHADPANAEAMDGLTRVAAVLVTRFEEAMSASRGEQAAVALAQFKSAVPNDARVAEFQSRWTKLHTEILRAQQQEAQQKRLAEEQAAREAAAAEQKKTREAKAVAVEAERRAQLALEQEARKKLEAEAAEKAAALAAQSSTSGHSSAALQNSLKRKYYVAPEYPREALDKALGGVVKLSFTVTAKGETQNIQIESAEPAKVFDAAAIAAVKRWRYEPLTIDGVPTDVPVRLAIRFTPPK